MARNVQSDSSMLWTSVKTSAWSGTDCNDWDLWLSTILPRGTVRHRYQKMRLAHHIALMTAACLLSIGCSNQPIATPLHELILILDQVADAPLQTEKLCTNISPIESKEECILIGVDNMHKKDHENAKPLCAS